MWQLWIRVHPLHRRVERKSWFDAPELADAFGILTVHASPWRIRPFSLAIRPRGRRAHPCTERQRCSRRDRTPRAVRREVGRMPSEDWVAVRLVPSWAGTGRSELGARQEDRHCVLLSVSRGARLRSTRSIAMIGRPPQDQTVLDQFHGLHFNDKIGQLQGHTHAEQSDHG